MKLDEYKLPEPIRQYGLFVAIFGLAIASLVFHVMREERRRVGSPEGDQ